MIYLDNASTTRIDPLVLEAMLPYLKEEYGNAGTIYALGRREKRQLKLLGLKSPNLSERNLSRLSSRLAEQSQTTQFFSRYWIF